MFVGDVGAPGGDGFSDVTGDRVTRFVAMFIAFTIAYYAVADDVAAA